jgi:hypothetical protein
MSSFVHSPQSESHRPQDGGRRLPERPSCRQPRRVLPADPDLPLVFSRAEALVAGLSDDQVDHRVLRARWDRLRRGYYTRRNLDDQTRWRAEVLAVVRTHRRPLILSHAHAARAWGLPGPLEGWGPISFTSCRPPARLRGGLRIAVRALPDEDIVCHGQVLVTSPARTLADCSRILPPHDALAMADAALHRGLTTHAAVRQASLQDLGRAGAQRAQRILALADARRETSLESWSAWSFAESEVEPPVWQVEICDRAGVFLGRVDAWWRHGVAGEADGRLKYRLRALERGGISSDGLAAVLDEERRREAGLRRSGALVVRWEARDVLRPAPALALAAHIRGQLDLAGRLRQFTGRVSDV